jgi:hypothetical protein
MSSNRFATFCRQLPTLALIGVVDFYTQRKETSPARYRTAMQVAAERGIY